MERIELCDKCNGYGKITEEVRTSAYDTEDVTKTCSKCAGTGRLKITTTIVVEPYFE